MKEIDWNNLSVKEMRELDETDLAQVPVKLIPTVCARIDTVRKSAYGLQEDCKSLLSGLNARAYNELFVGDAQEAVFPAGKFKKTETDRMVLPKETDVSPGGWPAVIGECIRRHQEDGLAIDEAFSWMNSQRLNPKAFADIEDTADLPIGIGRSVQRLAKFTATKPKL